MKQQKILFDFFIYVADSQNYQKDRALVMGMGLGISTQPIPKTQILKLPRYITHNQHPIPKKSSINTHIHTQILIKLGIFIKNFR